MVTDVLVWSYLHIFIVWQDKYMLKYILSQNPINFACKRVAHHILLLTFDHRGGPQTHDVNL